VRRIRNESIFERDPNLERRFIASGVRIVLGVSHQALFAALEQDFVRVHLPFGWQPLKSRGASKGVSVEYEICSAAADRVSPPYRLFAEGVLIAQGADVIEVARALGSHGEHLVAQRASEHLFVHAGVVGWHGCALVMPGSSFAGKTTLVRAWLDQGATYYSDEFAVLDRAGRVHPFARPLAFRDGSASGSRRIPVAALGADAGTNPLPVGLVIVTSYRAGAQWRPRPLTPATALLAMMQHTVAARSRPAHAMAILRAAVIDSAALAGPRGEASAVVAAVLKIRKQLT
jgi:hypothetical protein